MIRPFNTYALIAVAAFALQGCSRDSKIEQHAPQFQTEYQMVFLDNGQSFIGKLEGMDTEYPLLKSVFYIKSQVNPETKEVVNMLVKRGKEWHNPESMHINARHILVIEPVAKDSMVAKLIAQANTENN